MIITSSFLAPKPQQSCIDTIIRDIMDVIIVQSVFAVFLQCSLDAKKLNVIIIRWSTAVASEKIALALCCFHAYWSSAPYPMLLFATSLDRKIVAEYSYFKIFVIT